MGETAGKRKRGIHSEQLKVCSMLQLGLKMSFELKRADDDCVKNKNSGITMVLHVFSIY